MALNSRVLAGYCKQFIAAAAAIAVAAGCVGSFVAYAPPGGSALQVEGPLLLAFRYPEKVPVRYAFRFSMKSMGTERSNEAAEGVVHIFNEGVFEKGFNSLRIRRQETKRRRVEVTRGVETVDSSLNDIFMRLSPNMIRQDPADPRFSFPVDAYGRFAVREETPFHHLFYDSLCYFLPAMSPKGAAVGETWTARIPVILGFRYASNEFTIEALHTLDEVVRLANGHKAARITFTFSGCFDTAADPYAVRFTDAFRSDQRIINKVEGSGKSVFDIDLGLVLWKDMSFKVTETRSRSTTRSLGQKEGRAVSETKWQTDETVYDVREAWSYIASE